MVPRIRFRYACRTWLNALSSPFLARSISSNSISTATARLADCAPGGNQTLVYPREKAHTSLVRLQHPRSFGRRPAERVCAGRLSRARKASERTLARAVHGDTLRPGTIRRFLQGQNIRCIPLGALNELVQSCLSAIKVGQSCPDCAGGPGGGLTRHLVTVSRGFCRISHPRSRCDVLPRPFSTIASITSSTNTPV